MDFIYNYKPSYTVTMLNCFTMLCWFLNFNFLLDFKIVSTAVDPFFPLSGFFTQSLCSSCRLRTYVCCFYRASRLSTWEISGYWFRTAILTEINFSWNTLISVQSTLLTFFVCYCRKLWKRANKEDKIRFGSPKKEL